MEENKQPHAAQEAAVQEKPRNAFLAFLAVRALCQEDGPGQQAQGHHG